MSTSASQTRWQRFTHWAIHTPGDWWYERSCLPPTVVVAGMALAGLVTHIPPELATGILLGNWLIPAGNNAVRAAWNGKASFWSRPQVYQHPHFFSGPERPVETNGHHQHEHPTPAWRVWLATRASQGRCSRVIDNWLNRPSHLVNGLAAVTSKAEAGGKIAKVADDFVAERSRIWSFLGEAAIVMAGLALHAPWAVIFPMEMLFHDIPDVIAGYVATRTGESHRLTRPGLFQREGTIAALVEKGEISKSLLSNGHQHSAEPLRQSLLPQRKPSALRQGEQELSL